MEPLTAALIIFGLVLCYGLSIQEGRQRQQERTIQELLSLLGDCDCAKPPMPEPRPSLTKWLLRFLRVRQS